MAQSTALWSRVPHGSGLQQWSLGARTFDDDRNESLALTSIDPWTEITFFAGPSVITNESRAVVLYQRDQQCRVVELSDGVTRLSQPISIPIAVVGRCDTLAWTRDGYSFLAWGGDGETRTSVERVTVRASGNVLRESLPDSFAMSRTQRLVASATTEDQSIFYLTQELSRSNTTTLSFEARGATPPTRIELATTNFTSTGHLIGTPSGTLAIFTHPDSATVQWRLIRTDGSVSAPQQFALPFRENNHSIAHTEAIRTTDGAMILIAAEGATDGIAGITLIALSSDGTTHTAPLTLRSRLRQRSFIGLAATRAGALVFEEGSNTLPGASSADTAPTAHATPIFCD